MAKPILTNTTNLKNRSLPVLTEEELGSIVQDLKDSFEACSHPNKVGLSAPQIGIFKQVAYIKVNGRELILVNPEITSKEDKILSNEQCLSLPGLTIQCDRYRAIKVKSGIKEDDRYECYYDGYEAIIIQHETDHLKGLLITDRKHRRQ